jgi:ATP-binding cassette subfamily C protein
MVKLKNKNWNTLVFLTRDVLKLSGQGIFASFVLQIFTGFTQGIGIVLLIPLLSMVGVLDSQVKGSGFTEKLVVFIKAVGIPGGLVSILLFYVAVVTITSAISNYQNLLTARIQQKFIRSLKDKLYVSLGNSEWYFVSQLRMSDIAHVVTSEVQRAGQVIILVMRIATSLVTIGAYLVVAFVLSPSMAGLSAGGALLLILTGKRKNRSAANIGKATQHSARKVYHVVLEHLSGLKVAKSFADEDRYINEFLHHSEELEHRKIDYTRLSSRTSFFFGVGTVIILSVYVYIAIEALSVSAPVLLVLIYIFSRLLPKVSAIQSSYQSLLLSLPAVVAVTELQSEFDRHGEDFTRTDFGKNITGTIEFRGVTFQYDQKPLFTDLSLIIPMNRITVITGKSGSGKTTLVDLLLGLLKPQAGEILVGDGCLNKTTMYWWRKNLGYVTQDSFLFNGTIYDNLIWTDANATDRDLWIALEKASADEMVKSFPSGLQTIVGDRGARLSGGERQRLALARALVRKPALLILDEATNSLDPENENRILNALERLRGTTTMVIVTHSPKFFQIADQIVHLDNGKISHA